MSAGKGEMMPAIFSCQPSSCAANTSPAWRWAVATASCELRGQGAPAGTRVGVGRSLGVPDSPTKAVQLPCSAADFMARSMAACENPAGESASPPLLALAWPGKWRFAQPQNLVAIKKQAQKLKM